MKTRLQPLKKHKETRDMLAGSAKEQIKCKFKIRNGYNNT
jgi:hypothetical protein